MLMPLMPFFAAFNGPPSPDHIRDIIRDITEAKQRYPRALHIQQPETQSGNMTGRAHHGVWYRNV